MKLQRAGWIAGRPFAVTKEGEPRFVCQECGGATKPDPRTFRAHRCGGSAEPKALARAGLTLEAAAAMSDEELLSRKGIGEATVREIRRLAPEGVNAESTEGEAPDTTES